MGTPRVLKKGVKYYGESDIDGGLSWFVLDAKEVKSLSKEEIFEALDLEYYYGGIGQYFSHDPWIRYRTSRKVLVCQSWGYDV